jgi:lipopolysaccharide biosynthesis regulator YciM
MTPFWLFLLVFSAIACGWLLGRYASGAPPFAQGMAAAYRQYYRGLNYLLNERADEAIDAFIESLPVTPETFETHLALGNLMRRKGVVERAIQIHQNLLARPDLPPHRLQQAHLELARDFISAGLLDRAEKLLLDLVQQSEELRATARRHLVEIYQAEREWQKAIDVAARLLPRKIPLLRSPPVDVALARAISHYHCELALQAQRAGDENNARAQLKLAQERDSDNPRALLQLAELDLQGGDHAAAVAALQKLQGSHPELLATVLPKLREVCLAAGDPQRYRDALQALLNSGLLAGALEAMVAEIRATDGDEAARAFLRTQMQRRPTLRTALALLQLEPAASTSVWKSLEPRLHKLVFDRAAFQCGHCGFAVRQLHWQCPSCKQWGTFQPLSSLDTD